MKLLDTFLKFFSILYALNKEACIDQILADCMIAICVLKFAICWI